MTPSEALNRLKNPLAKVISQGNPFAAIFTCSDPRVCPELLFGCDLGQLFVVRTAGHVLTTEIEESFALALLLMKIPLIVVLGHQDCKANEAARNNAYPDWNLCKRISGSEEEYSVACKERLSSIEPFQGAIAEGKLQIHAAHLSFTDKIIEWI